MSQAAHLAGAEPCRQPVRTLPAVSLRAGALAAMVFLLAVFAWRAPGFLLPGNLENILQQAAVLGLLAFGMTAVVIAGGGDVVRGGIDLSVAANTGFCAALYAVLAHDGHGDGIALAATLLAGTAIGGLNALAVLGFGILPLLATLAVMNFCGGLELTLMRNTVVSATTPLIEALGGNGPLGLPWLAIVFVAAAVLLCALLDHPPLGLRLRAVGAHREAARAGGLRVGAYVRTSYRLSGACAAVAALLPVAVLAARHGARRAVHRRPGQRVPVAQPVELLGQRRRGDADPARRRRHHARPSPPRMSGTILPAPSRRRIGQAAARATLPAALVVLFVFFAVAAPGFLSIGNLRSLLVDHFVVLGFIAGAMTLVVIAGGIDLSLGTAALAAALAAALMVAIVNAFLIGVIGIAPFLATLGTLFIG